MARVALCPLKFVISKLFLRRFLPWVFVLASRSCSIARVLGGLVVGLTLAVP